MAPGLGDNYLVNDQLVLESSSTMTDPPASWTCPSCGASIATTHLLASCAGCGKPLPSTITGHLEKAHAATATPEAEAGPGLYTGQWLATSQTTFDEAYEALLNPPRVRPNALLLVGSMSAFLVAQAVQDGNWWWAAALAAVVLLHELGHYAGMWWFGYRDVQMFFVPFVGAAVTGRPTSTAAWKDGVVTLLGPLPGIVLGLGLALAISIAGVDKAWAFELAGMLILLNAFNLIPLGPLDGGRLFQNVLFSRHIALELAGGILGGLGLLALATVFRSWLLAVIGLLPLVALPMAYRTATAARWLRRDHPILPVDPAALDPSQRFALFTGARTVVPDKLIDHPPSLTKAMHALLASFRPRPSLGVSVLLVGAWAAGLVAALIAVVVLGEAQPAAWARHECAGLGVGAEFPGQPFVGPRETTATPEGLREAISCSTMYRSALFSITMYTTGEALDEARRGAWLSALGHDARIEAVSAGVDGFDAADISGGTTDVVQQRLVFAGSLVYRISTLGATAEDGRRFVESFGRSR